MGDSVRLLLCSVALSAALLGCGGSSSPYEVISAEAPSGLVEYDIEAVPADPEVSEQLQALGYTTEPEQLPSPNPLPRPRTVRDVENPPVTLRIIRGSSKEERKLDRRSRRKGDDVVVVFAAAPPEAAPAEVMFLASGDGVTQEDTANEPESKSTIVEESAKAEDAIGKVEVQEEAIEDQIEDAEELNDELAAIIAELRQQKGLPPADPYKAPSDVPLQPLQPHGPAIVLDLIRPPQGQVINGLMPPQSNVPPNEALAYEESTLPDGKEEYEEAAAEEEYEEAAAEQPATEDD
jgi:hypothetical protein